MDGSWLDRRSPPAPGDLRDTVDVALGDSPEGTLLGAAAHSMRAARSEPGRVRESAFRLLTADALITYACESALEGDDPESELAKLLAIATFG